MRSPVSPPLQDKLQSLVKELGQGHRILVADLADRDQLERVKQDVTNSGYSLLVNNAGYGIYGRFEEVPVEQQEHLMSVNMNALVRLSHAFLKKAGPGMRSSIFRPLCPC